MRLERQGGGSVRAVPKPFEPTVQAAKAGDDVAVTVLYQDHVAMVYGYFRACGAPDPDDLTSEVFLGMLRGLNKFNGGQPDFRRWLMTIAHRRLVDSRRRQGKNKIDLSEPASLATLPAEGASSELRTVEIDSDLVDAFRRLTDSQREVLALRFLADVSLQDVAGITGRPTGAVKSLQNRGLESLRRNLPAPKARLEA
ncbi:MAG: sigma-70 family RNA polymerase sigma factor [Acidimicrobiia bacterium]|nr:sigma-70 family RNA polymerase sigma factor [Acidimicrobiia bacterium]